MKLFQKCTLVFSDEIIRYSQRSGRWRAWAAWHTRWKEGKRQREVLHCLYPGRGRKAVRQLPTMPLWSRIGCHPPSPKTHTFAHTHKHSNKAECLTQQTAGLTAITHVCLLARSLFFQRFSAPLCFWGHLCNRVYNLITNTSSIRVSSFKRLVLLKSKHLSAGVSLFQAKWMETAQPSTGTTAVDWLETVSCHRRRFGWWRKPSGKHLQCLVLGTNDCTQYN